MSAYKDTSRVFKAVYPAAVEPVTQRQPQQPQADPDKSTQKDMVCSSITQSTSATTDCSEAWEPPVTLDHLTRDQQVLVEEMLRQECKAFAQDEDDVRLYSITPYAHHPERPDTYPKGPTLV